ncbi:hypothetical protein AB1L42_16725 [Thalassoglobus sp. JC818]|uniref:hypothetical protein n=1 Tax=Thalassoglobus sp. JC818 TaxID=3232136 RepID=UPI0034586FB8
MRPESRTHRFDRYGQPDPTQVASIKKALSGFGDASGVAFQLDTGEREIQLDGELSTVKTDVHVEGRHDAQYLRGYPILSNTVIPDAISRDVFSRLQQSETYARHGPRSFFPSFGVTFTSGPRIVDLLFGAYLYVYLSSNPVVIRLSSHGVSYFEHTCLRIFSDDHRQAEA